MATVSFPVTCSLGHPPRVLNDDTELLSHHTSEHASVPLDDYRASLTSAASAPTPGPPTIRQKKHATAYARFGLTSANFASIKPSEVSRGGMITTELTNDFLKAIGAELEMAINPNRFFVDLFLLILEHGGTDDVAGLGGTTLYATNSPATQHVTWSWIKERAVPYFDDFNIDFSFRRWQHSLDDLFWEMWNDLNIAALDSVRANGTTRSSRFFDKNGFPVPAYIVVPDLFNIHLGQSDREARKHYNAAAQLDKAGRQAFDYVGVTGAASVSEHTLAESAKDSALRTSERIRDRGGLGSYKQPRVDPIMRTLYPHLFNRGDGSSNTEI